MDTSDKMARLSERLDKMARVRSLFELLLKLSERVWQESARLEQRCLEGAQATQEESDMKSLKRSAQRLKQIVERSDSVKRGVDEAGEILEKAFSSTERIAEPEDTSIDEMLDRGLTLTEESQTQLEQQLFELHALAVELDRKLNKNTPPLS